ncbi:MAG TPA: hypothetical protein VGV38_23520 [Pyrinomonadaceae bacterium]|nr:hypothetical protein [Pyrinomonadaceae bacterium]
MKTIAILPEGESRYRALLGDKEATGHTAGEALDALRSQLTDEESSAFVIMQDFKPDEFFNAAQQQRLAELMQLREARALTAEEGRELETLVEAELIGARDRARGMAAAALQYELIQAGVLIPETVLKPSHSVTHISHIKPSDLSDTIGATEHGQTDRLTREQANRLREELRLLIARLSQSESGTTDSER